MWVESSQRGWFMSGNQHSISMRETVTARELSRVGIGTERLRNIMYSFDFVFICGWYLSFKILLLLWIKLMCQCHVFEWKVFHVSHSHSAWWYPLHLTNTAKRNETAISSGSRCCSSYYYWLPFLALLCPALPCCHWELSTFKILKVSSLLSNYTFWSVNYFYY